MPAGPVAPGRPAPPSPDTIPATPSSGEGTTADTAQRAHIAVGLRTLPRQYWLLIAGTFVYATGVEMCYPFQTLYLNQRLGLTITSIGVIIGATLFAGLPFQIVGGAVADRFGRRPVLILAICAGMALYIGLGVVHPLWLVIALFAFEAAFGWAQYLTASNAMVTDLTPLSRRAEAFSISRVALNAGITIGPLVAAPLISFDPTFRTSFLGAGLVCGIFLVMVLTLFKETRPPSAGRGSIGSAFRGYGQVLRARRMLAAAFVPWPFTFPGVIVSSFGIVLFIPISSTVVSHLTPTALRGRYMGSWTMVYIGGYALGPLLGGWAIDALGGRGAFAVVAATGLLGALLFPLLRTKTGARDEDRDGTAARAALGDEPRGERPEQAV